MFASKTIVCGSGDGIHPSLSELVPSNEFTRSQMKANQAQRSEAIDEASSSHSWFQ